VLLRNTKAVKNEVKGPTALEHSLKQEVEDLKLVCSSVEQQLKDNKIKNSISVSPSSSV